MCPETWEKDQRKERQCLGCDSYFMSEGPWNRYCTVCKKKSDMDRFSEPYRTPFPLPHDRMDASGFPDD